MSNALTVECKIHFSNQRRGRKQMEVGEQAPVPPTAGRVPRISRLMALAIHFDDLLRKGEVKDYADLARLGHVTRARVTQIMNLLNLAPDIQEWLLFLPAGERRGDEVYEWQVRRPMAGEVLWKGQRRMWARGEIAGD
ncbi:MAG TPA: hypothetical protein VK968_15420 [Roseimicrobium sp.]|nr:hypothetical protein [Roseimicrobium sp.]